MATANEERNAFLLDLRLLHNGFRDFLQWRNGSAGSLDWRELLTARINKAVTAVAYRRADRLAAGRRLVYDLSQQKISRKEKIRIFRENGDYPSDAAAERAFYRHLRASSRAPAVLRPPASHEERSV